MKSQSVAVFAILFIAFAWSAMTGGFKDVDASDDGVQNALNWAVGRHNMAKNDMYRSDLVEVLKAQSQVVSGMKYVITVKMAKTNCRKDRANEDCGPTQEHYQCTFTVWSRPWLSDIRMVKDTCTENFTSM